MTSQLAERYRDERIFFAGDAAHRFPPTGGLELNTGVRDVHNQADAVDVSATLEEALAATGIGRGQVA